MIIQISRHHLDSIHWRKQKKERKSDSPSKPGHKGTTHDFKPTRTIYHDVKKCSSCGGTNITQTTQHTRIIAEIPKPSPVTITKHVIPSYFCKNCHNTTASCSIPKKGDLGFNIVSIILLIIINLCGYKRASFETTKFLEKLVFLFKVF